MKWRIVRSGIQNQLEQPNLDQQVHLNPLQPPAMDQGKHPDSPPAMASMPSGGGSGLAGSFDGRIPATTYAGYGYTPDQAFVHAAGPPLDAAGAMQFPFGSSTAPNPYSSAQVSSAKARKEIKRRTKTGCLTCRKRRIKCDETQPTCDNCRKSRRECAGYDPTFRNQHVSNASLQSSPIVSTAQSVSRELQQQRQSPQARASTYPAPPVGYAAAAPSSNYFSATSQQQPSSAAAYDFSAAIDPALQNITSDQTSPGAAMYSQPGDFHVEGEPAFSLLSQYASSELGAGPSSAGTQSIHPPVLPVSHAMFKPVIPRPEGMPFGVDILSPVKQFPPSPSCDCYHLPPGSDELHHCVRHGLHAPGESPVEPDLTFTVFCTINFGLELPVAGSDHRFWSPTVELCEDEAQMLWELYCENSRSMFRITFYHGFYSRRDYRRALFKASTYPVDGRVYTYQQKLDDLVALTLNPVRPVAAEELLQVNSLEYPTERPAMPPAEDTMQQIHELFNYYSTGLAKFLETQWLPVHGWAHLSKDPALLEKYALLLSRMEFTADRNPHENLVNLTVESHIIWDSLALVENASDEIKQTAAAAAGSESAPPNEDADGSSSTPNTIMAASEDSSGKTGEQQKATTTTAQINPPPPQTAVDGTVYIDVHETALRFQVVKALITNNLVDQSLVDGLAAYENAVPTQFSTFQRQVLSRERAFWRNTAKFLTLNTLSPGADDNNNNGDAPATTSSSPADPAAVDDALMGMRSLLESKENRDIMYSVAVMRVWPRRLMDRERAILAAQQQQQEAADAGLGGDPAPVQLDKEDLKKVDIAKNFLVQQAGGRGTTVASQRICGMIMKAWGGAGLG